MSSRLYGINRVTILVGSMALLTCCGCGPAKNTFVEPPPPEVTVSTPLEKPVTDSIELTGNTTGIESVDVRARVQGFLEKVDFKEGMPVKEGQLLFEIDPRTYQAEYDRNAAALAQAKAGLTRTEADFQRALQLKPQNAISQSDYDLAVSARDEATAAVQVAEANLAAAKLNLDYTKVIAPINGRVGRRLVDVGNLVGAGEKTLLTTIVNDETIYAYINMPEYELLELMRKYQKDKKSSAEPNKTDQSQQTPPLTPAFLALADENDFPHEGYVDFLDNRIDPGTGTIRVRTVFPNPDHILLAGLFVRIRIPLGTHPGLLVPEMAVLSDQTGRYVLVVNDQNIVEQRQVSVSSTIVDHMLVIEEGLKPTDRVVVNGLQRARPGVKVKAIAAPKPTQQESQNPNPQQESASAEGVK